jgi:hypothetical protein
MKISSWVFKIRGFEGRIGVPKHGGPHNSTRAGLLNHETSKFSPFWLNELKCIDAYSEFEV